jgi:hypothetical protein
MNRKTLLTILGILLMIIILSLYLFIPILTPISMAIFVISLLMKRGLNKLNNGKANGER